MNAGADAILASLNPVIPSPPISNPAPGAASLTTGPSGATASTGGFVNAGHEAHPAPLSSTNAASSAGNTSTEGKGFLSSVLDTIGVTNSTAAFGSPLAGAPGGGLASSPNVPRAGSSIDPATGKPHTAGLTRAELEAKKAKVLNDAVASHSGTAGSSGSNLSDLSGREQAAAQLNASFITVPGGGIGGITNTAVITPGPQVPGAWGDQRQAPLPGTNKDAVTSVYDDVTDGLEKLGTAAYNLIPKSIKDAINNDALDKGKQPEGQPPQNRRSSVTALFEQAKHSGEKLVHDARESINSGRRESLKGTQTRAPGTIGSEGSVFSLVKSFVGDIANSGEAQIKATGLTEKKTTLPSEEILGTQPGDKTAGVGALPGLATEQGVAVLPDEKTNQGTLPGEVLATSAPSAATASAHRDVGLAPALPATVLGAGAAKGATDLEVAGLSPSTSQTTGDAATLSSINTESSSTSVETGNLSPTRHAADRTNSAASITAIRGGHEGAKPSPLAHSTLATDASTASVPEVEEKDNVVSNSTAGALPVATGGAVAGAAIVTGQKSTTRGTGDEHTTSLTPGDETAGVGHPDSRGQNGTSREPGTYPKANHDGPATGLDEKAAKPSAITTANHGKEEKTEQPSAPAGDGRVVAPKIEEIEDHPGKVGTTIGAATGGQSPTSGKGHNRTGSTDSGGKKKVGFMSKLKGEIKVIGGKIQHDEKKIAEGEKLKHGEL